MRRVWFVLFALCVSALTACKADHKAPIYRGLNRGDTSGANANAESEALAKASPDKDCLNLDAVTRQMSTYNDLFTVYTSDMDLGNITGGKDTGDSCMHFASADSSADADRAAAFLKGTSKPRLQMVAGKDLVAQSWIGSMLATASQDKCNTVTLTGSDIAPAGQYSVVCHSSNTLTIQAPGKDGMFISYYLGRNSLTVTSFGGVTVSNSCAGSSANSYKTKNTTVITWTADKQKLTMRRQFANLLNKYMTNKSVELGQAVTLPKSTDKNKKPVVGDQVGLSFMAMSYILDQVSKEAYTGLDCPAK